MKIHTFKSQTCYSFFFANQILFLLSFFFLNLFLFSGCSQDKDVDDYRREKLEEENAKAQSLAGNYRGSFTHLGAQEAGAGSIEIQLSAESKISTVTTGNKPEEQVVIRSKVNIEYGKSYQFVFPEGFFDSVNRVVKSSAQLKLRDEPKPLQVDFTVYIDSENKLKGKLEVAGFPNFGGQFEAIKDAILPADYSPKAKDSTYMYEGDAHYPSLDGQKFVEVQFLNNNLSDEEEFVDLLVPYQIWQLNFKLSKNLQISFPNVQWDRSKGTLSGKTQVKRGLDVFDFIVSCQLERSQWRCQVSNNQNGMLFTGEFKERQPGKPATRAPGEFSSETQPKTLPTFYSYTSFADGFKRPSEVILRAPQLNSDQEFEEYILNIRTLHGTLKFSQTLQLIFNDLEWNVRAGTLEGVASYLVSGGHAVGSHDILLRCTLMDPNDIHAGANCIMESNRGVVAENLEYRLKPKKLPSSSPRVEDQNQGGTAAHYVGKGLSHHNDKKVNMKLSVFNKKLSSSEEFIDIFLSLKVVDVTLVWLDSSINVSFLGALWDKGGKTLVGTARTSSGSEQFDLKLDCLEGPNSTPKGKNWKCQYFTNQWGLTVTADFLPQ